MFPFRQRSNGRPQRVILGKHALLPVLPQRRHEIDYTIWEPSLLRHKILQSVYQTVANRDHDFHCLQR